jgi:thiol-disulfide isomerase/thioredoxin
MKPSLGPFSRGFLSGFAAALLCVAIALVGFMLWAEHQVNTRMDRRDAELDSRTKPRLAPPVFPRDTPGGILGVAGYDWKLRTLDGRDISFTQFKGRVVLLTLWATWCRPCIEEIPTIARLAAYYRDQDSFAVILVSDEDPDVVGRFVQAHGQGLTFFLVREGLPAALWDDGRPSTVLIDCSGEIAYRRRGAADWSHASARQAVDALLERCRG